MLIAHQQCVTQYRILVGIYDSDITKHTNNYIFYDYRADHCLSYCTAKFHIPLDLSNVPVINQFVGRDKDLNHLWNLLHSEASAIKVVVLHRLDRIGKIQLALHFAHLYQDDFSAIFWLNRESKETLMRSLAAFLPRIPDVDVTADPKIKEDIKQQARQVL